MTKTKKTQPRENTTNMPTKGIKEIKEIKLKYLPEKENEYGTDHFFAALDETPLQELVELKNVKMPIWVYNGKLYLKINAVKS